MSSSLISPGLQKRIEQVRQARKELEADRAWKQGIKYGYLGGRKRGRRGTSKTRKARKSSKAHRRRQNRSRSRSRHHRRSRH
jgi:hypothetical protein